MTTAVAAIIAAKVAEAAETPQYTSTNCQTLIDKLTATNKSAGTVVFTARLVNLGGTAGAGTAEVSVTVSILAGKTYSFNEFVGHTMEAGDFISTLAGTAAAIELRGSGRKIT